MIKVTSHMLIGTKIEIFEAWKPTTLKSEYASLFRIDGELYGRIGTSRNENYEEQFQEAYAVILLKHPELVDAKISNGRIEVNN